MRTYDVVMRGGRVADSTGGRHVDDVGIAGANVAPDPPLYMPGSYGEFPRILERFVVRTPVPTLDLSWIACSVSAS